MKNGDIATLLKRQRKKFEPVRDARVHNSVVKYAVQTDKEPPFNEERENPLVSSSSQPALLEYVEAKEESPEKINYGVMG